MARPIEEKFELLELLGEGAAGEVHRARLRATGEEVALKVLHGHEVGLPQTRERFAQEAQLLMQVRSPYVVRALTAGAVEGRMYLAMEFVRRARDLGTWAREERPAPGRAREVAAGIAEGLAAVHQVGVVHRDLKPANVLIGVDDVPRLADFGLAKSQEGGVRTATGIVLGTPGYMAPEVLRGKPPTPAADVYALGGTLYYLLTGRPLFDQQDLGELLDAQRAGPSQQALGALAPGDAGLVCWLSSPDPEQRPDAPSAAEGLRRGRAPVAARTVAAPALARDEAATLVVASGPVHPDRDPASSHIAAAPPPPGGRTPRALGALSAAALLGTVAWWVGRAGPPPPSPAAPRSARPPQAKDPVDTWVKRALSSQVPDMMRELRVAADQAFGEVPDASGGPAPREGDALDRVTRALLRTPDSTDDQAAYRQALLGIGLAKEWRRVLRDRPDLSAWWHAAQDPEGRRRRRALARRLLGLWPWAASLRTLGAKLPEELAGAEAALAPVLRLAPSARSGPLVDGFPLAGLNQRCWGFFEASIAVTAQQLATLGGLLAKKGFDHRPQGMCQDWSSDRAGFFAVARPAPGDPVPAPQEGSSTRPRLDLVPATVEAWREIIPATLDVPQSEWVELAVGFFDMHPSTVLLVQLEGAGGEGELVLPFHLTDHQVANRSFQLPFLLPLGEEERSRPDRQPVRQSHCIHRSLLSEKVHLRAWIQPLAANLSEFQRYASAATTARACLTALTIRGRARPPGER